MAYVEEWQQSLAVGVVEKQQEKQQDIGPVVETYPQISVVIPTRNEAYNLPYVLPYIPATVYEVILVDGHSTDDTIAVAQELLPGICILKQTGRGKGNALREGFAHCTGDIIVMLDADGSAAP